MSTAYIVEQTSGTDMLVEDYDMDEKQDVALMTPADSPQEVPAEPTADDCSLQLVFIRSRH